MAVRSGWRNEVQQVSHSNPKEQGVDERSTSDWNEMRAAQDEIVQNLAGLLKSGVAADSAEAMDRAEELRRHIDEWFYPCDHDMHANLAQVYETDPQYRDYYESAAHGLAAYIVRAVQANQKRNTKS